MASKTFVVDEKAVHQESSMLAQASVTLAGRDLCSIADLSQREIAAIMELAHAVKATPRVTGFLGGGNVPTPLTADEVNQILYRQQTSAERPRPKLSFEKNETVRIIEGPFNNFQGKVDEVNTERGTLRVMVTIFGRSTPVELEFLQVEKTQ